VKSLKIYTRRLAFRSLFEQFLGKFLCQVCYDAEKTFLLVCASAEKLLRETLLSPTYTGGESATQKDEKQRRPTAALKGAGKVQQFAVG